MKMNSIKTDACLNTVLATTPSIQYTTPNYSASDTSDLLPPFSLTSNSINSTNITVSKTFIEELIEMSFKQKLPLNLKNVIIKGSEPEPEDLSFDQIKSEMIEKIKHRNKIVEDPLNEVLVAEDSIDPEQGKDLLVEAEILDLQTAQFKNAIELINKLATEIKNLTTKIERLEQSNNK